MPLVRIDLQQGRTESHIRQIADTVQAVMLDVFGAPARDRYQIITEHPAGHMIAQDTGFGLNRTDGVIVIQIFQQGRSTEQKRAAYAALAERLSTMCGVLPTDLIISIVTNTPADWSFGLGQAQFLNGDLAPGNETRAD